MEIPDAPLSLRQHGTKHVYVYRHHQKKQNKKQKVKMRICHAGLQGSACNQASSQHAEVGTSWVYSVP